MDPHSFFADPDPAVFLNEDPDPDADPDPDLQNCGGNFKLGRRKT